MSDLGLLDQFRSYPNFEAAGRQALAALHAVLPMDLWMLTRTSGDDWIVLQTEDHGYHVAIGKVFNWSDSFCSRMVRGEGPFVSPDVDQTPIYRQAPIASQVTIGAYAGFPLVWNGNELFGTLCAIHPEAMPDSIRRYEPLVGAVARLLSTTLEADRKATEAQRRAQRAELQVMTDEATGLYNERGWDELLTAEEARSARFGHPASLLLVEVEPAFGDDGAPIADGAMEVAQLLYDFAEAQDVLARLGERRFALLMVQTDVDQAACRREQLRQLLRDAGIGHCLGFASRDPARGMRAAGRLAEGRLSESLRLAREDHSPKRQ